MRRLSVIIILLFFISASFAQDKTAKDYKVEGKTAFDAKDYEAALEGFENAIQLYEAAGEPDTTLYYNAGICAIKVKDYEKSQKYFATSEELDYKPCKSKYYKAVSLKGQGNSEEMVAVAEVGYTECLKLKSKFNKLLFGHYQKEGLSVYNSASTMLNTANQYIQSDQEKYNAEMTKVKAEFKKALPLLEKAKSYKNDDTINTAIEQAKNVINS